MKLLFLFTACLVLAVNANAAKSLTSKGNKPSAAIDETAEMLCNVLVQASKELIHDGSVKVNLLKEYLRQDCSKLPKALNLVQKCQAAVDTYVVDIVDHLQMGTELDKICPLIQGRETPSLTLPQPKSLNITPNQTCVLCEFVLHLVQTFATANTSAQELANILENICTIMPTVLKAECKTFIETYGIDIIALLVREFDPSTVCTKIKLCPKQQNVQFLSKPNPHTCGLCDYVETYLSAGYPKEKACQYFSTDNNVKQQCETLVNLYKPGYCPQLQICKEPTTTQPIQSNIQSAECSLCKFVVSYVENIIQNNKSAAAVEAALEKVCSIIPGALKDKCDKFVNTYGPLIAILLAKYNDTTQVCNALKACNNGTETPLATMSHFELPSVNSAECSLCKFVVSYVENIIQNNKSAAAVEAALEKVCSIIPGALKDKCDKFVNTYGPLIAILLAKYNDTTQVCNALKACNNGTELALPELNAVNIKSAECTLCKFVVSYVENIIQTNKSAAAIEAALEKVCSIIPGALKDKCDKFVTTYGPLIAILLAKYNDTTQVCNALKACNNGTEFAFPELNAANIKSAECSLCKYIVSYVDSVIQNNKSEAAIEAALEKVCTILPTPLKAPCKTFVDTYGPILVKLLEKYTTPEQVCDALKICNNGTQVVLPKIEVPSVKSAECSLCKYIVSYVDSVIQNNKSEAAIEAALEKVCTILPTPLKAPCKTFVDTYGPILVKLLEKYTTPEQVCDALKICNNGTQIVLPKIDIPSVKSAECSLCKYIVSYVDSVIQNNKSEAAIEAALEKVCTILPTPLKAPCKTFVDTYGPILVKLLEKYTTPEQVCDALKICSNGTQVVLPKIDVSSVKSAECSLCKYIVSYVDSVIQNNKSEAAIEAALEKVCTILPTPLKAPCKTFVDTYGPILVKLLEKYTTPEQVCDALKICNNGTQVVMPIAVPKLEGVECSLCKYIVGYVEHIIENNKTEAAVEAALEKVCTILPSDLKTKCENFVETYGSALFALIEKYGTADAVCKVLKMCLKETESMSRALTLPKIDSSAIKSAECSLCKYVVSYVDSVIQNNKSEAAIEAALEKVCTILPTPLKAPCKTFVDTYGPILVKLLEKYTTPEQVCDALKLCNNGSVVLQPLTDVLSTPRKVQKRSLNTLQAIGSSAECSLCKFIISYLDNVIQNNKSEAAIEAALDQVCKILPGALVDKCKQFVNIYGPVIPQLIIHYGTPEQVCNALKACNNGTQIAAPTPREILQSIKSVGNDLECSLCKYVINYINVLIASNASAQEIEKALEHVCGILPTSYHKQCNTFVDQYGLVLVQLVAELDDPNVVCQWLSLCTKTSDKFIEIPAVKKGLKALPCSLCQYVVNYLDVIVKSNATETDFEKALDQACDILPGKSLQGECETLVNLYGPAMINYLVSHADPKTVCQAIGICDK